MIIHIPMIARDQVLIQHYFESVSPFPESLAPGDFVGFESEAGLLTAGIIDRIEVGSWFRLYWKEE